MAVQRDSNKHGQIVDDQLKQETEPLTRGAPVEPHVEEDREREPAADGEPFAASVTSEGLAPDPISARVEISRQLGRSVFPATRDQLLEVADEHRAPAPVLDLLEQLPPDVEFHTVAEVWDALPVEPIEDIEADRATAERVRNE
jgi:hypothetical protein